MTPPDDSSYLPVPVNPPGSTPAGEPAAPASSAGSPAGGQSAGPAAGAPGTPGAVPPILPPPSIPASPAPGTGSAGSTPLPPLGPPLTYQEPGRRRRLGIRLLILALVVVIVAVPVGLVAGGYVSLPSISLISSPRPTASTTASAPPSQSEAPSVAPSAMPLDVANALRVTVVINQRLAVNAAGLRRQLARSSVNTRTTAGILRAVATNANQAIDTITRMSDWQPSASLRTSLLAYYRTVLSTATNGLSKTLTSQSAYRTAASREYKQLKKLSAIGKPIAALATTWSLPLPTPTPAPTPTPKPAPTQAPSPSA